MVQDQVCHKLEISFNLPQLFPITMTRVDCRVVDHAKTIIRTIREKREYMYDRDSLFQVTGQQVINRIEWRLIARNHTVSVCDQHDVGAVPQTLPRLNRGLGPVDAYCVNTLSSQCRGILLGVKLAKMYSDFTGEF